ncbi:MAG: BamA/TamA family outer membrane protein [Candidatus Marinimicrobia bacterium]|nr:BamA/TamA family outer membrane protein [Candidatus Neomarinimicrobiota bacterium]
MSKIHIFTIAVFIVLFNSISLLAQSEKTITGWSFGGVPAIAYNSDTGFTYGIIVNTYNYGDGSTYPEYLYSIYTEWSRTTKGSGINKLFFDSKYLLPAGIRLTGELSYLTEQALPFYGFNGYGSEYDPAFEISDDEHDDYDAALYRTRVFYRHERNITKITADFQKQVLGDNLRGVVGFGFLNFKIGTVDIDKLNEGKDEADKLPDILTLYDEYVIDKWIPESQKEGGLNNYLKFGLVYDTRDNEPNPMSGIWTEALLTQAAGFMGSDFSYTILTLTHRQYFTLIPKDLSLTYRFGYQGVVAGDAPFFALPFYQSSYKVEEGLGGSKSLRGIMKNRVVGNAVGFGNLELRWKFLRTVVFNQNLYLALNAFVDGGTVLTPYSNAAYDPDTIGGPEEKLHLSYGGGFRIALNENFIIAVDYGLAADKQDGSSGLYIGLGYLY